MQAVRKVGREKGLVVEEVPIPGIGEDEVLVAVEAAGVCGSDLHIWKWDEWSAGRIRPPLTIGHELAGAVVEVGRAVTHVAVGDYVSAESHVTCGVCDQCRTGQAHLCPETSVLGVDRDGAFADYIALPEKVVWQNDRSKLPPEIAALQEPFGNAVFAASEPALTGKSVAVLGCGPVGLFTIAIARAFGAAAVFAADLNEYRLGLARTMGADHLFNPRPAEGDGDTGEWLVEYSGGTGVDVALEMSGAASAIDAAFRGVRNGGHVTLFGIPSSPVQIDVAERMIFKNVTVTARYGRRIFETWYRTRWLLESGVVDLRPLVTAELGLEQIDEAMALLDRGEAAKIVLRPKANAGLGTRAAGQEGLLTTG